MNTIGWPNWRRLNQEGIVFAIAIVLFAAAAIGLPGFIDPNNLVAIVRSVSACWASWRVGMAIVIIGRGIDLLAGGDHGDVGRLVSAVAERRNARRVLPSLCSGRRSRLIGLSNGIPRRLCRRPGDLRHAWRAAPSSSAIVRSQLITAGRHRRCRRAIGSRLLGGMRFLDVPVEVFVFAGRGLPGLPVPALHQMGPLRLFDAGDNPIAARNIGIPVRPMIGAALCAVGLRSPSSPALLTAASLHVDQHARGQFRRCSTTSCWWR